MPWRFRMFAIVVRATLMPEIGQCTLNPPISPTTTLFGHSNDEVRNLG